MSENLVLEILRAMRADLREVKEKQREHDRRFSRIDAELLAIRRQAVIDAEARIELQGQFEGLRDRLDRIERRLELSDEPAA